MKKTLCFLSLFLIITTVSCTTQTPKNNISKEVATVTTSSLKQISDYTSSNKMTQLKSFVKIDMITTNSGYAITKNFHVVKTSDGGNSWADILTVNNISDDSADPALFALDDKTVYVASYTTTGIEVEKSNDGGSNWSKSKIKMKAKTIDPNEGGVLIFSFINNSNGYLLSGFSPGAGNYGIMGLYKTTNSGSSWSLVNDFDSVQDSAHEGIGGYPNGITFISANTGFVTCSMTAQSNIPLYKTKDCGKSWSIVQLTVPKKYFSLKLGQDYFVQPSAITFLGKDGQSAKMKMELVFQVNNKDTAYIYSSDDSGSTWHIDGISNMLMKNHCFVDNENGFGLDDNGALYATKDGGITWLAVP